MTIHSAKGLEFSTVFIVGLEENIFPSPMAASSARELEEERRLLYVAITRAENTVFLLALEIVGVMVRWNMTLQADSFVILTLLC